MPWFAYNVCNNIKLNKMKKPGKILALVIIGFLFLSLIVSCSNAVIRPRAGVDVVWGSHGPKVVPSMGIDVYGGGRY
jgi:hypothetical protein